MSIDPKAQPELFRPSSMLRRRLCPGSLALESTLPSVDDPNEYQAEGALLHALTAYPLQSRNDLKPAQLDLIETVEKAEKEFIEKILPNSATELDYIEVADQVGSDGFTLHRDGKEILRGHPDGVRIYEKQRAVLVMERKYGFKVVQSADANLQLRCYLVLAASSYPADNYYACLTQPRVSSRPQIVQYIPSDIVQARQEIEQIYDLCYQPDAPRRASPDGCEHCTAKAICEEFKSWAFAVERSAHLPSAQWSDETWNEFLVRRPIVEKFLKERLEDAKLIKAANPDRLPGWKLKPGAECRTVSDIVSAWSLLQSTLSAKEFSNACTISIGDIEETLWRKHQENPALGKLSQKAAKRLVNEMLAAVLTKKRNKPSLVKDE